MSIPAIYTVRQAAEYLGLTVPTIKHHIYVSHTLVPDGQIGHNVIFYQGTLDAWAATRRGPGRPPDPKPPAPAPKPGETESPPD
jgi:hypothetical protein